MDEPFHYPDRPVEVAADVANNFHCVGGNLAKQAIDHNHFIFVPRLTHRVGMTKWTAFQELVNFRGAYFEIRLRTQDRDLLFCFETMQDMILFNLMEVVTARDDWLLPG